MKAVLRCEFNIDLNGIDKQVIEENLRAAGDRILGDGMVTGDSAAEVDTSMITVYVDDPLPAENQMRLHTTCINSTAEKIHAMTDEAVQLTRAEFLTYANLGDVHRQSDALGYDDDFPMGRDWHVTYFRSRYDMAEAGEESDVRDCVYFAHSRIEHIFVAPKGE